MASREGEALVENTSSSSERNEEFLLLHAHDHLDEEGGHEDREAEELPTTPYHLSSALPWGARQRVGRESERERGWRGERASDGNKMASLETRSRWGMQLVCPGLNEHVFAHAHLPTTTQPCDDVCTASPP
jgi:hypothetical protein